jgi:L-arabinose isomerase
MISASRPLRIGFLPFYVDYYEAICADLPREKIALARRCAERLAPYGSVVWDGELIGDVAAAASAGKTLAESDVDVVVAVTTIAVFASIPLAAIRELSVPILIWNAQEIDRVGAGYSMVEIVRNTGQIGTQALANALLRDGREFRVVTSYENNSRTGDCLRRFFAVTQAATALKRARLLMVGDGFAGMTDIELEDAYVARHLGATITHISPARLTEAYHAADGESIKRETIEAKASNSVNELSDDELTRSVRLSVALQTLVDEHRADAGSFNCHRENCLRNPVIGITACYGLGVQNARGRSFTCTGDLPTALAMLLLKTLAGVAMYTEVQVMDEQRGAVVIANSGEGEDGIRRSTARSCLAANANFKGLHGRGASFAYPLQAGPATLVSLTPAPNGTRPFRLIVAEGEILDDPLPDAGALAGFFRFQHLNLHDGYTRWLEAGPVHHAATTVGHWESELRDVASQLQFEFVGVR